MTHHDLAATLDALGWTRVVLASGTVDYTYTDGPCDRLVRMIPEDPAHALCATRGEGRVVTSIAEAADWARAATVEDVVTCTHEAEIPANGHGSFCRVCGETLS